MSLHRRGLLSGALAAVSAAFLGGCTRLSTSPSFQEFLIGAQGLSRRAQRLVTGRMALAQEFTPADLSPSFKANGETAPKTTAYRALAAGAFEDFRLTVDGLVRQPLSLSLAELRALPARTQITRHDCVEGCSCSGQWTGAKFGALLDMAEPKPNARFIVFHCADEWGPRTNYYESIDLYDAYHPQTILAYGMNGAALPVAHGAPLRLRVERQLGYKHAQYVMRGQAVDRLDHIGGGKGGYWEDNGYEWYAGI